MTAMIAATSLFANHYLKITDTYVEFQKPSAFGGTKKFTFDQIDCVLLSPKNLLSFQVGSEVFSIPIKPDKPKHQEAVRLLLDSVYRSINTGINIPGPTGMRPDVRR